MEGVAFANVTYVKEKAQGHIDMHNQIRVAKEYGFQGVGFWGWSTGSTTAEDLDYTKNHWTHDEDFPLQDMFTLSGQEERLGEAVSNETWRNVGQDPSDVKSTEYKEFFTDAIPTTSGIVATVADETPNCDDGYWIQYDLKDNGRVFFKIKNDSGTVVRVLDWGFNKSTDPPDASTDEGDIYPIAPGRYRNIPSNDTNVAARPSVGGESGDMNGTAQFWDLEDYKSVGVPNGDYTIEMYVEGTEVGSSATVEVPIP